MKAKITEPKNTPFVDISGLFGIKNLFMKDETKNPTHTFKDRLAYEMIRPILESVEQKKNFKRTTFGSISYGNTAFSMGYYCHRLNAAAGSEVVKAVAFVPPKIVRKPFGPNTEGTVIPSEKVMGKISELCDIIEIDLNAKVYREDDLRQIAANKGCVLDAFVDITEGLDRPAYEKIAVEAFAQMKKTPDYVIVPFGAGILCNEVIDYIEDKNLKTKVIPVSSGDPKTIAIMLYGPVWVDTKSLLEKGVGWTKHDKIDRKGRKRKAYQVYHVTDDEILAVMKELKKKRITAEASGASGFAILHRLAEIEPNFNPQRDTVLVINTGNGLLNF